MQILSSSDYKLLTRVLADMLEQVLDKILHSDQIGFIRGRLLYRKLLRIYNVMYLPDINNVPEVIIA